MWQIYSAAEPVPWRNSFYVVTLIVVFPKSAHLTSKKVVKITALVTLSFVCVVIVDVCDYVGQKKANTWTETQLFPVQYMTSNDWLTAARTSDVFAYGYANYALHPTLSPQKYERPAVL